MKTLKFLVHLLAVSLATPGFMIGVLAAPIVYGFLAGYEITTNMLDSIGAEARERHEKRQREKKS